MHEAASIPELFELQEKAIANLTSAKVEVTNVVTEVARRFAGSISQALTQADKTHGTVSLQLQDGYSVKGDIKQKVDWDSDILMALAQTMPWDRVEKIFKIKFSMSETIYKGLAAASPETVAAVDKARTVTLATPIAKLVKDEAL